MKELDPNSQEYKTKYITQYAQKVIANSFYGCLGFRHFRLYNKNVAESVTYIARMIIKEVARWFEEKGFKIIYGDTDSIFVSMEDRTIENMTKLKDEVNIHFKTYFKQFGVQDKNNIFELEFEKVYKTIFFKLKTDGKGAKKKYAGQLIWKDGKEIDKFDLVGFESRRSDSPQVGRDFIKKILEMICYEKPKTEIDDYVEQFRKDIKFKFTPEQIALPMGITKPLASYKNNPIHVRASNLANSKHNAQIQGGDKIKYLYVYGDDGVIAFKVDKYLWDGYEINYERMIARLVDMKVGPLYESLGWEYNYPSINNIKKRKGVRFADTLIQGELW